MVKLSYEKLLIIFTSRAKVNNDLYPGTIYSPPSYDVRFPSAIMSS